MKHASVLLLVLAGCQASRSEPPSATQSKPQAVCGTSATAETKAVYDGLKAECASCHLSGTRGYFGSLGAFQALMVSDRRLVSPGNPDGSELLKLLQGQGTGAFKQMPIAGPAYAQRTAGAGASIVAIRAWIVGLSAQTRDQRPDPFASTVSRLSAQQVQRALYQQLGLVQDDFFSVVMEYSSPMAESRGDQYYPIQSQDALPPPRQEVSSGRFQGLGGGTVIAQIRPDTSASPTFGLTLQQLSQAWCRRALTKTGNLALFPAGTAKTPDAAAAKATMRRWSVHFHSRSMPEAEVEALHSDLFVPLLAETNQDNAYTGLCSYFIRHPLWIFY